ncbi:hypothetical protein EZ313_17430 [Ramlibacter henchirensis]|uniref:Uncharacterized protein n=1 Tax=Ramlibacter henchirensis TaxID=204072 RepID=A0A4Z0BUM6_9BURK|nr:hypothetical protein [Ramlibacter henchirensis]TFZ03003.1 hypothetical protein EZ313_17430 [Ramlibacter henchirensis]
MSKRLLSLLLAAAFGATAQAKLPAPQLDDAAKAKAAEAAARTAWQAKVDAFQLCKAQDRVAAKVKTGGNKSNDAKATPVVAKSAPAPAAAASAPAAAASGATTPTASAPPAPCVEPGPFAFNPPEQKPLETSGAHSPTGTSGGPPSVRSESAQMAPAKPTTGPSGGAAAPAAQK